MSKFTKEHYAVVAEVIEEWIRINQDKKPETQQEYVKHAIQTVLIDSLINGFDLMFRADSNAYNMFKFGSAIKR